MDIVSDPLKILSRIKLDIKKFGHFPEHNYYFLLNYSLAPGSRPFYFSFKEKGGILFHCKNGVCLTIPEPIAPQKEKLKIFLKTLECLFGPHTAPTPNFGVGVKKIKIEDCTVDFRKEILKNLPASLRAIEYSASALWPVFDLKTFDEDLKGKKWKRFRYVRNLFLKTPQLKIVDPGKVGKALLKKLVLQWKGQRKIKERVDLQQYLKTIDNNFLGCDLKKIILINEKPAAIAAGWKIPNNSSFYIFMDIHDYNFPYLGEFSILNHFLEVKKRKYQYIDFGGSDDGSLAYKKKFFPTSIYKTYDFSIVRK